MVYEINLTRIHSQANYLSTCLQVLQDVDIPSTNIEYFAVMRSFHIGVECIIDIGNTIIDGFIMRDPGGYSDIIDILEDEQVIPFILANKLKDFVKLREQLVRYYDQVEKSKLEVYIDETAAFQQFLDCVEAFINKEKANGNVYV
jgi:uncharacterized protein YutE (UPF0331/DUF86 family)